MGLGELRGHLAAGGAVFAAVKPTDTSEDEVVAALVEEGYEDSVVRQAFKRLGSVHSIVEVRPKVWQRWHGVEAQEEFRKGARRRT
jgi:hypothetical protein